MSEKKPLPSNKKIATSLIFAGVLSQVGLLTLGVILIAILIGLWLDNIFDTKALFTIILVVLSFPISVAGKLWIVRKAAARLNSARKSAGQGEISEEADDRGTDKKEG